MTLLMLLSSIGWSQQKILHVGNSYTLNNNLDAMTAGLLSSGGESWQGAKLAAGGLLFTDHVSRAADTKSPWHAALASGQQDWAWVVLQEQSQLPGFPEDSPYVIESTAAAVELDDLAEARGAQTLLLLTWGRRDGDADNTKLFPDFSTMQAHLTEGYLRYQAATTTAERPTWIAPAGLAFAHVYDTTDDPLDPKGLFYALYAEDGSHPSLLGSYLTACVIYVTLTGNSAEGLPTPDALDEARRLPLQQAADAAVFGSTELLDFPWESAGPTDTADTDEPIDDTASDTDEPAAKVTDADEGGCGGRSLVWLGLAGLFGWRSAKQR
ncbi:MAG: hypothetical protein ACI8S6_000482 [Myxococcota bacterium]|jgi:hypothetical protein